MRRILLNPRMAPASMLLSILVAACTTAPTPSPSLATPGEDVLRPGDAVRVEVWRAPDLSGEFMVTPEGVVAFPLIGDRDVRGVAPADLEASVGAAFRAYLENPSVTVTVLRRIAILGAVQRPGLYTVDRTMSLRDALALAGGLAPNGDSGAVRLIRDGRVLLANMDLARMVTGTSMRSGDQVEVGERSWISRNTAVITSSILATASIIAALIVSR